MAIKMAIKMAIIAVILGVIALISVGFLIVKSKQQAKIKESSDIEKKYSDYKYFREIKQAEKYDLIPLDCYIPPYFAQDGSVVIFAYVPKGGGEQDRVCYKLDKEGNVKDSLMYNKYNRESEYFINKEGYITWLIDGDKRVKAYRIINNELWFNEQSFNKVYDEMYEKSEIVRNDWFAEDAEDGSRISIERTYFFRDGEWIYIDLFRRLTPETFGKYNTLPLIKKKIFDWNGLDSDKNYYSKGGYDERVQMQTQKFSSTFDERDGDISQLKTENFQPVDFIREEYHRRKNASPFSPTGGMGSPNRWSGIGFIDLILNEDTLKIKMNMHEIARNNGSYSFGSNPAFTLYYDEKVNFFILNFGDKYCYLIKPKIDQL